MRMELAEYIDKIECKLINNFDIYKNHEINDLNYDLYAKFFMRNEKYLLVKKAVIYAFENNEHVLMKHYKNFDNNDYNNFMDNLIKSIKTVINPSREHMSSIVTGVIVADNVSEWDLEHIKKSVSKFRYNKSFAFGYKGWAEVRLVLVSLRSGLVSCNKAGKEVISLYNL